MKRGFTLVELLVTISIISILTAVLVSYNRSQEIPLLLFREQSQLVSTLNRAKVLSIRAFNKPNVPCGIGVHFEPSAGRYFIFRDVASNCSASDRVWGSGDEIIPGEDYQLENPVYFAFIDLRNAVFIPPDPILVMDAPSDPATIQISHPSQPSNRLTIRINNAGQITVQ